MPKKVLVPEELFVKGMALMQNGDLLAAATVCCGTILRRMKTSPPKRVCKCGKLEIEVPVSRPNVFIIRDKTQSSEIARWVQEWTELVDVKVELKYV